MILSCLGPKEKYCELIYLLNFYFISYDFNFEVDSALRNDILRPFRYLLVEGTKKLQRTVYKMLK